jgi:sugar transferase (PEP-CTERM/EpsH1 system associated)
MLEAAAGPGNPDPRAENPAVHQLVDRAAKMRVLFLAHRIPFPPNKGDKIRAFNILKYLAKHHEVHLACLVDDERDLQFVPEIQKYVGRVVFDRIQPRVKKLLALNGLLRSRAITVGYFYSPGLQRQIDDIIDTVDIDAFVCSSSPMAEYLFRSRHANAKIRTGIKVMDLIDVDSCKWRQYAEQSPVWTSWIYRYEAEYLAEYEKRIARTFDHVLVVSQQEKSVFPGGGNTPNLEAMSNGVDLEFFKPDQFGTRAPACPTLVFTGAMDYRPNIEGIRWFVESVLPYIQVAVPDVELLIVGNKPTPEVVRLGRLRGVVVTGFVEDVRKYLARASVCVVPLRVARGIQNKILEAMAMGKAVVCTPQAHEGIRATSGKELVAAEGADDFSAATIDLLLDQGRATQLGLAARQCVEREYSWEDNLQLLDRILPVRSAAAWPTNPALGLGRGAGAALG